MDSKYNIIFGGCGPSSTGLLLNLLMNNQLHLLTCKKVCLIDKNANFGSGSIHKYNLYSNSHNSALLDISTKLEKYNIRSSSGYAALNEYDDEVFRLTEATEYLNELGNIVKSEVKQNIFNNTEIVELHIRNDDSLLLKTRTNQELRELECDNLILNLGGEINYEYAFAQYPELCNYKSKIQNGMTFLMEDCKIDADVTIIGAAFTAWCVTMKCLEQNPGCRINIVHRSRVRVFFMNQDEARQAQYEFDPTQDICPLSGRVNRYSGLRGKQKELVLEVLQNKRPNIRLVPSADHAPSLLSSDQIILATGFKARDIPIYDQDGTRQYFDQVEHKAYTKTTHLNPSINGRVIPNIFMFGLGAGIMVNDQIGGEKSYQNPVDGIWLYYNDIGDYVRKTMQHVLYPETRSLEWQKIYSRKGMTEHDEPLHILGGYNQFTFDEWKQQVDILLDPIDVLPSTSRAIEIGCGAGAFIEIFKLNHPHVEIAGVDYCQSLVDVASSRLPGTFMTGNACNLFQLADQSYDIVLSFGMTAYLDSLTDVNAFVKEALRIVKPGGKIYIGEVSDLDKQSLALSMRKKTHSQQTKLDHLYIPKSLFLDYADQVDGIQIVDHSQIGLKYMTASYRYSVYIDVKN